MAAKSLTNLVGIKIPVLVAVAPLSYFQWFPLAGKYTSVLVSLYLLIAFLFAPNFSLRELVKDDESRGFCMFGAAAGAIVVLFGSTSSLWDVRLPIAAVISSAGLAAAVVILRLTRGVPQHNRPPWFDD